VSDGTLLLCLSHCPCVQAVANDYHRLLYKGWVQASESVASSLLHLMFPSLPDKDQNSSDTESSRPCHTKRTATAGPHRLVADWLSAAWHKLHALVAPLLGRSRSQLPNIVETALQQVPQATAAASSLQQETDKLSSAPSAVLEPSNTSGNSDGDAPQYLNLRECPLLNVSICWPSVNATRTLLQAATAGPDSSTEQPGVWPPLTVLLVTLYNPLAWAVQGHYVRLPVAAVQPGSLQSAQAVGGSLEDLPADLVFKVTGEPQIRHASV
jgi:hypothetical protein